MSNIVQQIPFHEDVLYAIVDERTQKAYVLPKPMAEMFGLTWQGQAAKLARNQIFAKGIKKIMIPSAGGPQETLLLERRLVHPWLLSIDSNRVRPSYRDKLLRYQNECADVLDEYFTRGVVINPRAEPMTPTQMFSLQAQINEDHEKALALVRQALEEHSDALARTETKADLALEDAHRLTLEEFILKNGLVRQFPASNYRAYAAWLTTFCATYGLRIQKAPVYGKAWDDENAYPLAALGAWLRHETKKPRQVHLVHTS